MHRGDDGKSDDGGFPLPLLDSRVRFMKSLSIFLGCRWCQDRTGCSDSDWVVLPSIHGGDGLEKRQRRLVSSIEYEDLLHIYNYTKKNYLSQRGLRKILRKRQRLLSYLSKKNRICYKELINRLDIRESKTLPPCSVEYPQRNSAPPVSLAEK
ncbi:hypothetical protein DVH24_035549 [Malus domestica]|uniref:Small ribosomal subunit protein uS15c n=1 Tax=Malus domestica TaxID=3750 RepID=A0A498J7L0_MALDO|nr:hypothetical protein DVH24_035549 [Malus domestica]